MKVISLILAISLVIMTGCEKKNVPPKCKITSPSNDAEYYIGDTISISVEAEDEDGFIFEIRFYIDGVGVTSTNNFPFKYDWDTSKEEGGMKTIKVTAKDDQGTIVEDEISVLLKSIDKPQLTTAGVTDINVTTAIAGGNITADGGAPITARGICWSSGQNPTISDDKTSDSIGVGSFISQLTGLHPNTTYYVRAYATNSAGTAYGNEKVFNTHIAVPEISIQEISEVTSSSAKVFAYLDSDGGSEIISKGVCWSSDQNPTIDKSDFTNEGTGVSSFSSELSDLNSSTKYYVRSYAKNSAGIGYSEQSAFTTNESVPVSANFKITTDIPGETGPLSFETDMVFIGEQVEFHNETVNGDNYLWEFGDGNTSDLNSPLHSFEDPGTYTVTLKAFGQSDELEVVTKTLYVAEGVNSSLRITVLEYYDEYPVEGASVLLYGSLNDWENQIDPSYEVFTTPLGKCVFEGLNYQQYYVDVWEQNHDNYTLAAEDVAFIETQSLEPGYIHDFIAYVDYYEPGKKAILTRVGKKKMAREIVSMKESSKFRKITENKFSQER